MSFIRAAYKRVSTMRAKGRRLRGQNNQEINMIRINRILVSTAVALALGVPLSAGAADTGFYIGALAGSSKVDLKKADWDAAALDLFGPGGTLISSSLDTSDTAFGAVFGYQFMPNFGVEAYYLDLGKVKASATGTILIVDATSDATVTGEFKTNGPAVALVGSMPFAQTWVADVRAGIYYGDTKITVAGTASGGGGTATLGPTSDSQSRSAFMGGLGIGYSFSDNLSLRFDYLYFDSVGIKRSGADETANINVFALGVRYMF
jgi:opacity protein-like surface antigen